MVTTVRTRQLEDGTIQELIMSRQLLGAGFTVVRADWMGAAEELGEAQEQGRT
ncbi:hypothetical protein JGS22_024020 [Streptomyces sp. P38-E01]|uniref:Uncharacterized protein n=1 Tax=Streptomyces tardus TaxID=2780544 RepID=A0A949JKT1_9ACTN|nr:hypothetical protein [Streptomyces tardus]MBU7600614.1 hypothetical protein [Streptomyces tardus]